MAKPGDGAGQPPIARQQPLRYRWQGGPHLYAVRVEADKDDALEVHQGACVIDARKSERPRGPGPAEERKASGTGFVVNADGYLITCAHVVADATKVEVVLGGQTYPATVLVVDHDHDLALLHIAGKNLPALALANSDAAEVGMEVRPFGFPLSNVLGDSLKVTRGTLSGVNHEKGHKVFQIDASINPGNSGGPLMTENGEVLGVTIAKLFGEAVSNVGFATPSKEIERLLTGKNVAFTTGGGAARLDGPTLVKRVSPAVALIKVILGENTDADTYALTCRGRLVQRREPKAGGVIPGAATVPLNPMGGASTQVEIDGRGHLVKAPVGSNQLPFLLGDVGLFLIEALPPDTRPTWETSGECTITEGTGGVRGRPPLGMPRHPGFPRPGNPFNGLPGAGDQTTTHKAKERTVYTRGAATAETVTIKKHYELTSENGLTLIGDGQITFDVKTGTPRASDFQATLTVKKGNTTQRMPLSVRYTLLEGAERDRVLNPPKVDQPKVAQPKVDPPKPEPKLTVDKDMPQILADLKGMDRSRRRAALERLAESKPNGRRAEVVKALDPIADDSDSVMRQALVRAAAVWGTTDNVPALLKCLDDANALVRSETMDLLGKLHDERAVEAVARRLLDFLDRSAASSALVALGAGAEKAVVPYLQNTSAGVRLEACNILRVIGTKQSKPALEAAAQDSNVMVATAAKQAAAAVAARP